MDGQGFETWTLDRLSRLRELTVRPMLGGQGIYWRDVIFGIVFRNRLYLKVDERSKGHYLARAWGHSARTSGRP
jgi:TfoX/Sxy family transcriptional regulator of competence genes